MLESEELPDILLRVTCLYNTEDVLVKAKCWKACWAQDIR